jgi:hypothetical protein
VAFGNWLISQGCHALYADHDVGFTADLAKRAKPRRPIHRPDFLALMGGFGTLAFDIKNYRFKTRSTEWLPRDHWSEKEQIDLKYVRLVWEEVLQLYEFQRISNIPAWLCFIDSEQTSMPRRGWFYRVDVIHEVYARLFIARDLVFIPETADPIRLFEDWPPLTVERRKDDDYPSRLPAFDFLLDSDRMLHEASSAEILMMFHIPPIVLELGTDTTLASLIDLQHSQAQRDPSQQPPPTPAQIAFVESIAAGLDLPRPKRTKLGYSRFIEENQSAFFKHTRAFGARDRTDG